MGDERCGKSEYAEEVDVMILEYLIHSTTKVFISDFTTRLDDVTTQPSQSALTQLHILDDYLRIYRAKYLSNELDEEVRLWLELLQLLVLISGRRIDCLPLCTSEYGARSWSFEVPDPQLVERRHFWLSARKDTSDMTDQEDSVFGTWHGFCRRSPSAETNKPTHLSATLIGLSPLFFTISAKIACFIDQGISKQWVELAAQLMLQAALESCLTTARMQGSDNPVSVAFAWGWIPSNYWEKYKSIDRINMEHEAMINRMFEDDRGTRIREEQLWQTTRLKYLSIFSNPRPGKQLDDTARMKHLGAIAEKFPIRDFEKKVVVFLEAMWNLCRKPLLVQIEEGVVDGMTSSEFEDFKQRIFAPL